MPHVAHKVGDEGCFTCRDMDLIAFTDDFTTLKTVTSETWQTYIRYFKENEIIEAFLVMSHKVFFSLVNNALFVDIEPSLSSIPGLSTA